RDWLRQRLPEYMLPSAFVALERLPLTANGKIDRAALPKPATEDTRGADQAETPQGGVEAKLAEIWREVLGVPKVSRHDNFFELGGDSIQSIQVVSRARRFGIALTPKHVFQHKT